MTPAGRDLMGTDECLPIDEWIQSDQTEVVKSGQHRVVYRLQLETGEYFLKHFRVPDLRTFGQNVIRPSRADLEWESARRVREAGIPTIDCVAMGERSVAGFILDNYLLTKAIPDVIPLDEVLRDVLPSMDSRRQTRLRQLVTKRTGQILGRLHQSRLYHPDLHPGNILVSKSDLTSLDAGTKSIRIWLIDLHSLQPRRHQSTKLACRDLAIWHNFFARRYSHTDRSRFFQAYTAAFSEHELTKAELNRRCERELQRADRHGDRKWHRANSRQVICDGWGLYCRGVVRLGEAWLKAFRNQPTATAVTSSEANSIPELISWPMTPSEPRPRHSAAHAWRMGHALLRRNLSAIEPLAVLEPRLRNRKAYLLLAPHASYRPLPDVLNATNHVNELDRIAKVLGRELDRLHQCGFHYAEWDGSNVLFDENSQRMAWSHLHRLRQRSRSLNLHRRVSLLREIITSFVQRPRFQEHVLRSYTRHWSTVDREQLRCDLSIGELESTTSVEYPPTFLRAA